MNIHMVIAITGDFSDRKTWIVQTFADEAAAFAEAARLNAARPIIEALLKDYDKRIRYLQTEEAKKYKPKQTVFSMIITGSSDDPWYQISVHDRMRITQEIETHIGPRPDNPADDYTVVSIPIGERGRWELP